MIKLIIFFSIGILILIFTKKLIYLFTKNILYQYILYFFSVVFFILLIFTYRESKLHDSQGIYSPPQYDGKTIVPGTVTNEKE